MSSRKNNEPESSPAESLLAEAIARHQEGNFSAAEKLYRRLMQDFPACVDSYCNLGVLLSEKGEQEEAIALFYRAAEINPASAEVHNNLGTMLRRAGSLGKAIKEYRQALEIDPQMADANYNIAEIYMHESKEEKALPYLERAAQRSPQHIETQANLARAYFATGHLEKSRQHGQLTLALKDKVYCDLFLNSAYKTALNEKTTPAFVEDSPSRNIIAYSLWGFQEKYLHGAIKNAQIAPYIFPDWRCRFYCDATVSAEIVAELKRYGAQVVRMSPAEKTVHPLYWRFFVSDDPSVDRFLCRDADSRLNCQERVAVDEWIRAGKAFHIMRDHYLHTELILAGMWGGVAGVLPNVEVAAKAFAPVFNDAYRDQNFLRSFIWPLIKNDAVIHDSHFQFGPQARDFPDYGRRPGSLHVGVGESADLKIKPPSSAHAPHAPLLESRYVALKNCRHGPMAYNINDTFVGRSLDYYGELCDSELNLLGVVLQEGQTVLDVGANIGVHTVFLAKKVGLKGTVFAFEPQRHAYHLLCANIALNSLSNVHSFRCGVGEKKAHCFIPDFEPDVERNYGALSIEDGEDGEKIKIVSIDSLDLPACHLIKIDVEGMESKVLLGAKKTLEKFKPMLFMENNREEQSDELFQITEESGYRAWWHFTPYYNPKNYFDNSENIFPDVVDANVLCIHRDVPAQVDVLEPVLEGDTWRKAVQRWKKRALSSH